MINIFGGQFNKLWRAFILFFLISFLAINWNEISWVFNYRVVSTLASDLFAKGEEAEEAQEAQEALKEVQTADKAGEKIVFEDDSYYQGQFYQKEDSLDIPKINISAPLIFGANSDPKDVERSLDFGAVHFPESALPGRAGQTVVLGHSAPAGWPRIKYDWVFSGLNSLAEGDRVFIFFNNRKYEYAVRQTVFLERGEEISEKGLTNSENVLILISCWPPGKDIRRIAVEADLIKR